MALRDKMRARVEPYLTPGERVQAVFPAQGGMNPWIWAVVFGVIVGLAITARVGLIIGVPFIALVGVILELTVVHRRLVVVTDQAILVLAARKLRATQPERLLGRLPRAVRIGPVQGIWAKITLGPEQLWVHRRFHRDVNEADAALAS